MATASEEFVVPKSYVGPCVWFHGADRNNGHPAFIQKPGNKAVTLVVAQGGAFASKIGVLHIDDPDLETKPLRKEMGAWDYWRPEYLENLQPQESVSAAQVSKLTDTVKSLEKRLKSLEDQLK